MRYHQLVGAFASTAIAAPALLAPLLTNNDSIPGEYIVSFKDGHDLQRHEEILAGLSVEHFAPYGYTGKFDDVLLSLIRADPMVDFIEQDYYIYTHDEALSRTTNASYSADPGPELQKRHPTSQRNAPFNLDIASHKGKRTSGTTFHYDTRASGTNVDLYIVDSGVNVDHQEFGGRATNYFDATETTFRDDSETGSNPTIYGHGTEVADVAAGKTNGVAKTANILSVKIVTGANKVGRGSDAVTGIKRITRRHNGRVGQSNFRGSVVNYSVDIPVPTQNKQSLGQAVSAADAQNIIQVAAAGNSNDMAINHLPAAYTEVITVASMTPQYRLSQSTSYGTAVDIIAPGTGIVAAAANSNNGYFTVSGTSFASPLVAGVCAQFMSYHDGPQTKMDLYNMLINFSLKDLVDVQGTRTPNRVVNNGAQTKGWPPRDETRRI